MFRRPSSSATWLTVRLALFAALAWFYVAGATMHAERVNWFKARGDQSWFLHIAQVEYRNWHGIGPPQMLRRNIMPLYPAYLALFYDPGISDPDYFVIAKRWSIRLSLALLAVLGMVFARYLPALVATNLTLIVAFGYWVFKAGYAQPELLYYFLLFLTFLACCHLLRERRPGRSVGLAVVAGVLAALTHLTKAAMPLFLGVFFVAFVSGEFVRWRESRREGAGTGGDAARRAIWRLVAAGVLVASFIAVLFPYISTSKRVFGRYFYNANTTFYMWYDTWGEAGADMKDAGAETAWPNRPARDLPGLAKYWRTHTVRQIAGRFLDGLRNMVDRSYHTYWYYPFVILYVLYAGALIAARRRPFADLVRRHASIALFLVLYAVVFLLASAFYNPISATGTSRYLIAHLTPLFFTLAYFTTMEPFRRTTWRIGRVRIRTLHADLAISAALAYSIAFVLWDRLATTYGGF
jgi:hypothetical protein